MLPNIEVQNYQLLVAFLSFLVMIVTASWAYYRFKKEGAYSPRIQFDVECECLENRDDKNILKIFFVLENKGLVTHKIKEVRYKILALSTEGGLKRHGTHKHLSEFSVVESVSNIIPESYGYFFISPGVRQRLHIVTDIEDKYSTILIRATIQYPYETEKRAIHSAENSLNLLS